MLDFNFTLPEDQDDTTYNKIGNIITILNDSSEMDKLLDPAMLAEHQQVDHLSPQEIVQLAQSMSIAVPIADSNNNGAAALPQSV